MKRLLTSLGLASLLGIGAAFSQPDPAKQSVDQPEQQLIIPQSPLAPGPGEPVWKTPDEAKLYADDEEMVQAGRQLYAAMNCVGCHSHGGGGMGPPLMDDKWIYGSSMEHIFSSIREGRPNGMPAFRGRVPDEQIWQIAAYVHSMSK